MAQILHMAHMCPLRLPLPQQEKANANANADANADAEAEARKRKEERKREKRGARSDGTRRYGSGRSLTLARKHALTGRKIQ